MVTLCGWAPDLNASVVRLKKPCIKSLPHVSLVMVPGSARYSRGAKQLQLSKEGLFRVWGPIKSHY